MFKKTLAVGLAGLFIQVFCVQPAVAASKAERYAKHTVKVRAAILKLGTGTDARVSLKLRDDVKLAGYISETNADSFVVTDAKTRAATTVVYGDVAQVKGHNLGTGAKIGIGIAIGVGVTILVTWLIFLNYQD